MPTAYGTRTKPVTTYSPRAQVTSDVYDLADVGGNEIADAFGNQITVKGASYASATAYLQRKKP